MSEGVDLGARRPPTWALLLGAYALTRLAVFAATAVVAALDLGGARCGDAVPRRIEGLAALSRCWDTRWFVETATRGYPAALPADGEQTTLAFFPAYPALVAAVHALGVPAVGAAIAVSLVLGGLATLGVWRLARCVAPPTTSRCAPPSCSAASPAPSCSRGATPRPWPPRSSRAAWWRCTAAGWLLAGARGRGGRCHPARRRPRPPRGHRGRRGHRVAAGRRPQPGAAGRPAARAARRGRLLGVPLGAHRVAARLDDRPGPRLGPAHGLRHPRGQHGRPRRDAPAAVADQRRPAPHDPRCSPPAWPRWPGGPAGRRGRPPSRGWRTPR